MTCVLKVVNKCIFEQLKGGRRLLSGVDFDAWLNSPVGLQYRNYTGEAHLLIRLPQN